MHPSARGDFLGTEFAFDDFASARVQSGKMIGLKSYASRCCPTGRPLSRRNSHLAMFGKIAAGVRFFLNVALVITALSCFAPVPVSSAKAKLAPDQPNQLALSPDYFNFGFEKLNISVVVGEGAASDYDIDANQLLSALTERARAITKEINGNIIITAEDPMAFVGPDSPDTPPYPKVIHVQFNVETDPADVEAVLITVQMRRGAKIRLPGYFSNYGEPFKINARCTAVGCLNLAIVDGVSRVLRFLGQSPKP